MVYLLCSYVLLDSVYGGRWQGGRKVFVECCCIYALQTVLCLVLRCFVRVVSRDMSEESGGGKCVLGLWGYALPEADFR